jgi:hypothetical protein
MGKGAVFYSEIGKKARGSRFRIISIATSIDSLWLLESVLFFIYFCGFSMCMSFLFFVRVASRGGVCVCSSFLCLRVSMFLEGKRGEKLAFFPKFCSGREKA